MLKWIVSILAMALATAAPAQNLEKVRTYTQTNFPGFVNYAARELGFFTKQGIDPEMRFFPSGAPIVQAAAANEWDIAFLGAPPAVIGGASLGTVTISVVYEEAPIHQLMGRPDYVAAAVANPQKIKGAKVFVTTLSTGHYMVEGCLRKMGLSGKDVNIVPSEQTATLSAFAAGQGDLAQVWAPQSTALAARGNKVLCDGAQAGLSIPSVWVANKEFAHKRPDLVAKWLKANFEAIQWMKQDFNRTYELYKKWEAFRGFNLSDAVLRDETRTAMEILTPEQQFAMMTGKPGNKPPIIKAYDDIAQFFIRMGRLKAAPNFAPLVDQSYLQAALKQ